MRSRLIFNPFVRIAGLLSFFIGIVGLFLTSYIAFRTGTHFYGFLNIDFAKDSAFWIFFFENCSNWLLLSSFLYTASLLFSKSRIRFIDIFGTILFARVPLIISPVFRTIPFLHSFSFQSAAMYTIISIYLISVVWTVILTFNAFKVSSNLKNEKLAISFIVSLIFSEVLTKLLLYIIV